MTRSRFRSLTAWITLLPVILLLGDTYGFWTLIHMPQDIFTKLFNSVCAALIAFGVFHNPSDPEKF